MVTEKSLRVLDRIDREILRHLQKQGRISNVELARSVHLSPTPCLERTRRLEADGYIRGYAALLDPARLGHGLLSFVQVQLDRTTEDVFEQFKDRIIRFPEVMECHMVAGGFDYLIKVRTASMTAYREFLGDKLARIPGISQTHTYVVMEDVKSTHELAIK